MMISGSFALTVSIKSRLCFVLTAYFDSCSTEITYTLYNIVLNNSVLDVFDRQCSVIVVPLDTFSSILRPLTGTVINVTALIINYLGKTNLLGVDGYLNNIIF